VNFTKANRQAMADVLDADYESVEDAAKAALDAAWEIIQQRAKFSVVGQIKPDGDKVSLGLYVTQGQATNDALKLTYSSQTHEEARAWVLPVWHGTPANWYASRKSDRKDRELEERSYFEQELARRIQWFEDNPDKQPPEDWAVVIPFTSETVECWLCHGVGRIPND
jgi:hypothetical protein